MVISCLASWGRRLCLLRTLQPEWWFSAHLHTRFETCVVHGDSDVTPEEIVVDARSNPNEIDIDNEGFDSVHAPNNPDEIGS